MQSWGIRSRWDVRETGLEPTKSGVIGLIGCAMGLCRGDSELERLDGVLSFGVRVDRAGVISTDFHTVTGYHRTAAGEFKHSGGTSKSLANAMEHGENTIVSPRDYLLDAAFLVVLAAKPGHGDDPYDTLSRMAENLRYPKWPLYLGRKACVPTRPILDRIAGEYPGLEDALRNEALVEPRSPKERKFDEQPARLSAWIESADGECERQDAFRVNSLRDYEFRRCRPIEIETSLLRRRT